MTPAAVAELMRGAAGRVPGAYARTREWASPSRTLAALAACEGGEAPAIELDGYALERDNWVVKPELCREEGDAGLIIKNGARWWHRLAGADRPEANLDGDPGYVTTCAEPLWHLLDPAPLLDVLELGSVEAATACARPAHRVTALPRAGRERDLALDWLGYCAERYVLLVDAETGICLGAEAWFGGEVFRALDVKALGLEPELPEGFFDVPPAREG